MDKREAIRRFIKLDSKIYFLDNFPFEAYKKKKSEFFTQTAGLSPASNSEIGAELLEGMIKSHQILDREELAKIFGKQFFAKSLQNKDYYYEKLELTIARGVDMVDLKKIEEVEYAQQWEEKIKSKVQKDALDGIQDVLRSKEEQIQQKERELESIRPKSIIDLKDYVLPASPESETDGESSLGTPWWDQLHLTENPFPNTQGLFDVGREFYEEVTIKTSIFLKYQTVIDQFLTELFRNTIVFGQYGSGKTHFFQYFEQRLLLKGFETMYINFFEEDDVRGLLDSFRNQIFVNLTRIFRNKSGQQIPADPTDTVRATESLIKLLAGDYKIRGIIVFVDDIHKLNLTASLEFVNRLQPFTAQIRKILPNIAFYVAGSPEMERMMLNDPKFSGSLSREERMPAITTEIAQAAINKRLKAYARNPEEAKQVEITTIERIFAALQTSGKDVTFRSIIDRILRAFEQGDFKALTVNPFRIPKSTLDQVKAALELNDRLKSQVYGLIYGQRLTSSQKTACFSQLARLYNVKAFPDFDVLEEDIPYFRALEAARLIERWPSKQGTTVWMVSPALRTQAKVVFDQFHIPFEDYVVKIYGTYSERKKELVRKNQDLELADQFISSLPQNSLRELILKAKEFHVEILQSEDRYLVLQEAKDINGKCMNSLASLTRAYKSFEHLPPEDQISELDLIAFWKDFWYPDAQEIVGEYLRVSNNVADDPRTMTMKAINLYRQAFPTILSFIKKQIDDSKILPVPIGDLKNEEIKSLNECRNKFIASEYSEAARILNRMIERKIRTFLFDSFSLLYGDRENRTKWIDSKCKPYISEHVNEENRRGFGLTANEFNFLNRGQYKLMMTNCDGNSTTGRSNWLHIVEDVFAPWNEADLFRYLNSFAESNIPTSHDNFETFGTEQSNLVLNSIMDSEKFLTSINRSYRKILRLDHFRFDPNRLTGLFSFQDFKDEQTLSPIPVTREDASRLEESHADRVPFKVHLDNQQFIREYFGIGYRQLLALLAFLMNQTEEQAKVTKLRLSIVAQRGPETIFKLERIIDRVGQSMTSIA